MSSTETALGLSNARRAPFGGAWLAAGSLLAANAGLLFIYFYLDLTLFQLVLVYWWEILWIGMFSALKLIVASFFGNPYENRWIDVSGGAAFLLSLVIIGTVSTAFFIMVGLIAAGIAHVYLELNPSVSDVDYVEYFAVVLPTSMLFLAGHGLSFLVNFLVLGEFRTAGVGALVTLPFKRCFALLFAIVVAGAVAFKVPGFASSAGFAIVIVVLKLLWDYRLHCNERRDFRATTETAEDG
jgi:hypothetical protein